MSLGTKSIKAITMAMGRIDGKRMKTQQPPDGVTGVFDLPYLQGGNPMHTLDVIYAEGTTKKQPVLIDIHGGGWIYGNKEINRHFCMYYALEGFTVINVNYRLITEARFPNQIRDIFAVLNWLEENGGDYFCDLSNVFISGDSAGGHLASMTTALIFNKPLMEEWGVSTALVPRAAAYFCGVFDLKPYLRMRNFLIKTMGEYFLGKGFRKSIELPRMSFSGVYTGKMPPVYLLTSKQDFIEKQSVKLAKFFKEEGVEHELFVQPRVRGRKLAHVFNVILPEYEESRVANKAVADFLKKYIVSE